MTESDDTDLYRRPPATFAEDLRTKSATFALWRPFCRHPRPNEGRSATMDVTALRRVLVGVPASRDAAPPRAHTTEASEPAPPRHGIRPEIQALRALAVSLVVAWHLWPDDVPGGFVGVDVFFAISG